MEAHKTSINKFKKIKIISSVFLDHNGLEQETNLKKKSKHSHKWRLNNVLLNNEWVNNKIKEEIKKYLEINENEHSTIQNLWDTTRVHQRGKFIAIQVYLKKIEKSSQAVRDKYHMISPLIGT